MREIIHTAILVQPEAKYCEGRRLTLGNNSSPLLIDRQVDLLCQLGVSQFFMVGKTELRRKHLQDKFDVLPAFPRLSLSDGPAIVLPTSTHANYLPVLSASCLLCSCLVSPSQIRVDQQRHSMYVASELTNNGDAFATGLINWCVAPTSKKAGVTAFLGVVYLANDELTLFSRISDKYPELELAGVLDRAIEQGGKFKVVYPANFLTVDVSEEMAANK
jgi:hypothetical protein